MEDKIYLELAELIRTKRRIKNLTQDYMAAKLGITQTGYCKIESGKSKCSGHRLFQIFELLEFNPPDFLKSDRNY
ncbi:helix-turn-helix transcriptional regulator [Pedobacter panaciterrae]|uniref:helix-turn-helix domain-containing protein n=1 Tax=Pedobacter panaciterrae TaxID=363849 RepID=UPI00155DB05B|nr:helix-turn-helix transcriptional regulator [Pedobacter panaciterrae]